MLPKIIPLFAAALVCTAAAQTPDEIIASHYPRINAKLKCRIAEQSGYNNEPEYYCMKQTMRKTVDTPQGKMLYILWTGNQVDLERGEETGFHVATGMAGMFAFRQQGKTWQPAAMSPNEMIGAFSYAPTEWRLERFGADKWGFLSHYRDLHQGVLHGDYQIYLPLGKTFRASSIAEIYDTAGADYDCTDASTAAERRECLNRQVSLDTTMKIRRDLPADGGVYPLEISVSGEKGGRKFNGQRYLVRFNPAKKQYIAPKDYPLRMYE